MSIGSVISPFVAIVTRVTGMFLKAVHTLAVVLFHKLPSSCFNWDLL